MARWNNGYTEIVDGSAASEKNYPQNGRNTSDRNLPLSSEARKRIFLDNVRKTRGRFTSTGSVSYDFSNIAPYEQQRGSFPFPFIDFPGAKLVDGGDIRDVNAFGGGMPQGNSSVGNGVPSRKSRFNRYLPLVADHKSPVPRS
jgi:hypothetical protein